MSRRNDAGASYDRTLLSNIPDPTRAEKQVRYTHFFSSLPLEIGNLSLSPLPRPSLPPYPYPVPLTDTSLAVG